MTESTQTTGLTDSEQAMLDGKNGNNNGKRKSSGGGKGGKKAEIPSESGLSLLLGEHTDQIDGMTAGLIENIIQLAESGSDQVAEAIVAFPKLFLGLIRRKVEAKGGVSIAGGKPSSPSPPLWMKTDGALKKMQQLLDETAAWLPMREIDLLEGHKEKSE